MPNKLSELLDDVVNNFLAEAKRKRSEDSEEYQDFSPKKKKKAARPPPREKPKPKPKPEPEPTPPPKPKEEKPKPRPREEKPKPTSDEDKKEKKRSSSGSNIVVAGTYSPGNWAAEIKGGKSRAQRQPGGLMKDLGVKGASGSSSLEKAFSVVKQAVKNNDAMSEAFSAPRIRQKNTKEGSIDVCVVEMKADLTPREASAYIWMVLHAAENSGILRLEDEIVFLPASADRNYPAFYQKSE